MPENPDQLAARRAERERLYDGGTAQYGAEEFHTARLIAACNLCDPDGYRGIRVCDHIDHFTANASGRAEVRRALAEIAARRSRSAAADPLPDVSEARRP